MNTTTATVETLTAEVRVLMVGSRQVTLSVAKQLDVVELKALEPFGRVKIDADYEVGHVIGRRISDGTLVLAEYERRPDRHGYVLGGEVTRPILVCDLVPIGNTYDQAKARITWDGWTLILIGYANTWEHRGCGHDSKAYVGDVCNYLLNGQEDALSRAVTESRGAYERDEAAKSLPLIVLAGLK